MVLLLIIVVEMKASLFPINNRTSLHCCRANTLNVLFTAYLLVLCFFDEYWASKIANLFGIVNRYSRYGGCTRIYPRCYRFCSSREYNTVWKWCVFKWQKRMITLKQSTKCRRVEQCN